MEIPRFAQRRRATARGLAPGIFIGNKTSIWTSGSYANIGITPADPIMAGETLFLEGHFPGQECYTAGPEGDGNRTGVVISIEQG